jgi:ParB-like chromosome segregation protein Spo0J
MKVKLTNITDIKPYNDNPRNNAEAVDKVAQSIKDFGFRVPIVVDENMIVLAGHTRLKAAEIIGLKKVPIHQAQDLSDAQKKAFRIADNKISEFADWDKDLLSKEFQALAEMDFDLTSTAFDYDSIEKITSDIIEFDEPINEIESENIDLENIQQSNIRMVNLFLDTETEPQFRMMCEALQNSWGSENITSTTYEAVKIAYENIQS